MSAFVLTNLLHGSPFLLLATIFQFWMFIDAIRREEWIWAVLIFIGWGFTALFYFFLVYRAAPSATRGFELPGAHRPPPHQGTPGADSSSRQSASSFAARRHLFSTGQARQGRSLLPRGAGTRRARTLIRARTSANACSGRNASAEARPLLEGVVRENPNHDYGYHHDGAGGNAYGARAKRMRR